MKTVKISNVKNYKDTKFSYPKVKRNRKSSIAELEGQENKENINPNSVDFWADCKKINLKTDFNTLSSTLKNKNKNNFNDTNSLTKNYENNCGAYSNPFQLVQNIDFTSGRKDSSSEKNLLNVGTPAFYLKNSDPSSRKKNKNSSNKKVEFRYPDEEDYYKAGNFRIKNNSFLTESDKHSKSFVNSSDYKVRSNTEVNQKLNFEVISENYQNGKFNKLIN